MSSVPKRGRKSNIPSNDVPQPSNRSQTMWMGMDTPFKNANAWFVELGRSN